jgi:hypothetical protein
MKSEAYRESESGSVHKGIQQNSCCLRTGTDWRKLEYKKSVYETPCLLTDASRLSGVCPIDVIPQTKKASNTQNLCSQAGLHSSGPCARSILCTVRPDTATPSTPTGLLSRASQSTSSKQRVPTVRNQRTSRLKKHHQRTDHTALTGCRERPGLLPAAACRRRQLLQSDGPPSTRPPQALCLAPGVGDADGVRWR